MSFIDGVLGQMGLEPIKNLTFLSKKIQEAGSSETAPDPEIYRMLLALMRNNLETYQVLQDASIDKLTDALNRKYLDIELEKNFARARKIGECLSVIICDLDFFKQVNDAYGHIKGDEVLRETAGIISETVRGYGTLGRYGGEEFMAVLPDCSEGQAGVLAERIRKAVQSADILKGKREITLSLGVATFPQHANTAGALVEKADKALYMAKRNGRNRFEIWREDYGGEAAARDITSVMLTGDAIRDAGYIKALTELAEILNSAGDAKTRTDRALDKIIDTVGAEAAAFFLFDGDKMSVMRSAARHGRIIEYNNDLIKRVLETGNAVLQVDWDAETKDVNGLPDWLSLVIAPAVKNGATRGVIYMSVSIKEKEFLPDEAGFICNAATLLGGAYEAH